MRLLVIGGTSFLGRAVVDAALDRGDDVTTFNRGRTAADDPRVTALRGDRTSAEDVTTLAQHAQEHGRWDAVVDSCGYVPAVVGLSATTLAEHADRYVFVSSVSAYRDWPLQRSDEQSPLHDGDPDAGPEGGDYGVQKVGCERAAERAFGPDRTLVLRPGIILGPWENVGRLPWWLVRVARGGRVLAPGDPDVPMQLIDARDIATFTLASIDAGRSGAYNLVGPAGQTTFGQWLRDIVEVTGSDAELVWVPDNLLLAHAVEPWSELPLWMPQSDPEAAHAWDTDVSKALAAGLPTRDPRQTIEDTWAWLQSRDLVPNAPAEQVDDDGVIRGHGIRPAKEAEILAEFDGTSV
ncbi:MAG: NAD-dependent epimerase/dehydratase family protein [Actinomycetales bacterium]